MGVRGLEPLTSGLRTQCSQKGVWARRMSPLFNFKSSLYQPRHPITVHSNEHWAGNTTTLSPTELHTRELLVGLCNMARSLDQERLSSSLTHAAIPDVSGVLSRIREVSPVTGHFFQTERTMQHNYPHQNSEKLSLIKKQK